MSMKNTSNMVCLYKNILSSNEERISDSQYIRYPEKNTNFNKGVLCRNKM